LEALAGVTGDWGIAVILLTIIIRLLVMPLMTKSTASSAKMQALQPKLQELQERYADDPQRYAEEMQKFQAENDFNPLGGCLPVLLQMPVFFALFGVIKRVGELDPVPTFINIFPLNATASGMFAEGMASGGIAGGFANAWVYILFDILFGVLTIIPMWLNSKNMPEEQRGQSMMMGYIMAAMMLWFGWSVYFAVLLYYNTSAIWQVVQQRLVTQRVMDKVKAETEEQLKNQGVKVDVVRKEKKPRQHKKN